MFLADTVVLPPSSSDTSTSLGPLMVPQPFTYSTCRQRDTSVCVLLLCQYVIWRLVMLQTVRRHSRAATVKQGPLNLTGTLMVPQPFTYSTCMSVVMLYYLDATVGAS
jgi:hypothetical protein